MRGTGFIQLEIIGESLCIESPGFTSLELVIYIYIAYGPLNYKKLGPKMNISIPSTTTFNISIYEKNIIWQ